VAAPRKWGRKAVSLLAGVGLLVGSLVGSAAVAGVAAAPGCPEVFPTAQLTPGMHGIGYTVSQGTTPEAFDVEILGVLENGIGPGRDMIVIEANSPAIDRAGGIWAGMSGSPVYIDNKLVGAVAWGLTWGPSKVGGLTAATDMMDVLDYPAGAEEARALGSVEVGNADSRMIARRTTMTAEQVDSFDRLPTPVGFSGVSGSRLETLREAAEREGLAIIPFTGSSAPADAIAQNGTVAPGDNFAATLSYGDVTSAGIGTATAVCNGRVLAFGHPFFFDGSTTMGANGAEAITIVNDPLGTPYKLANIRSVVGVVDQDRLAAIRAVTDVVPDLIPISSVVTSIANERTRDGLTDAVLSEFVPSLTFTHMFSNIDVTFDKIGEGSSSLTWTVTGTTESGDAWELERSNMYNSEYDISFDSLWELQEQMFMLEANGFEPIEFTGVDVSATVDEELHQYTIKEVRAGVSGEGLRKTRRLRVRPGDVVKIRVTLEPLEGAEDRVVDLSVRVPRGLRGNANLTIRGGNLYGGAFFCYFATNCKDEVGNDIESFDELIAAMESSSKNNEVRAQIETGRRRVKASDSEALDQVVRGRKRVRLFVGR
jgi:SpoIVB peptidase S55